MSQVIQIALGLVWKSGLVLVARRRAQSHQGGLWEFPGGRIEPGESAEAAAEREVLEELGVVCQARRRRGPIEHDYGDRRVCLIAVDCQWLDGEPQALGAEEPRWYPPERLGELEFPEANRELVAQLKSGTRD